MTYRCIPKVATILILCITSVRWLTALLLNNKSTRLQKCVNHKIVALAVVLMVTLLNWIENIQKLTRNTNNYPYM